MEIELCGSAIVVTDEAGCQHPTFWARTFPEDGDILVRLAVSDAVSDSALYIQLSAVDSLIETVETACEAYQNGDAEEGDIAWSSEGPILYSSLSYIAPDRSRPCLVCDEPVETVSLCFGQPLAVNDVPRCYVHFACAEEFNEAIRSIYDNTDSLLSSSL